jgi:beta-1,2-mannobiose phosphorylase / 1,2-beta-oligomannan phosphorylase
MPAPAGRASENPILTPAMVRPSRPDLEVVGVFNPGVIRHENEVLLLLRVAEAPLRETAGEVAAPTFDAATGRLEIRRWAGDAAGLDASDPRMVVLDGRTWLTSISHLRIARSSDGIRFDVEPSPALSAATELESFGLEDPRITLLDGTYWINYTAVSPHGIATALASTRDFRSFVRHGIVFPPPNRDVTIFPERIGGRHAALHRPMPEGLGTPAIWIAWSPDLMDWGGHLPVARARPDRWDDLKVGGGAVPFRVKDGAQEGWLAIYHGVRRSPLEYALGALLLDARDPARVLARSREPILRPEAPYEREGFFGGVVFTCGVLAEGDTVRVYYGAADGVTAVADLSLAAILGGLS